MNYNPRDAFSESLYTGYKLRELYGGQWQLEKWDAGLDPAKPSPAKSTPAKPTPAKLTPTQKALPQQAVSATIPSTELVKAEQRRSQKARPWKLKKVLAGAHQGWVLSTAVDPVTNSWFVSGLADAQIKVWDLALASLKATLPGHIMGVRALAVLSRHPYLFSGAEDKTLRCWDLERLHLAAGCQIRNYHGHVGGVYAVALHPELDLLFSAGRDSVVRVWDIRSRTQVMVLSGHRGEISSLATQLADPQVCLASMDLTVKMWDLRTQKCHMTLTHHTKSVRLMALHPHELTMVSADATGEFMEWVLPGGQLLSRFGDRSGIVNTLAVNPATNELFAGYNDGQMQMLDYETGATLSQWATVPLQGTPLATIYTSSFDMSGLRLITGENDKSIKIWGTD